MFKTKYFSLLMLLIILTIVITACSKGSGIEDSNSSNFELDKRIFWTDSNSIPGFRIINNNSNVIHFQFSLNGNFWLNSDSLVSFIPRYHSKGLPNTDSTIAKAFWFIVDYTGHSNEIPLDKRYSFSPEIFVNSLGYGICSNRGAVLANLLIKLGYQSRCIHLGGHLVCEVYDQGKWKMLDPDYNAYFLMNGEIASVKEIAYNPLACKPQFRKTIINLFNEAMPQRYISFFTTKEDNVAQSWYTDQIYSQNQYVFLVPNSFIEIPSLNPNNKKIGPHLFGKMVFPPNYFGIISVPFVIHSISGNGLVYNTTNNVDKNERFHHPGSYLIVSKDSLSLYFYVNPYLFFNNDKKNILALNSSCSEKAVIEVFSFPYPNYRGEWLNQYFDIINSKFNFYKDSISSKSNFFNDTLEVRNENDFVKIIEMFYTKTHQHKSGERIKKKAINAIKAFERKKYRKENFFRMIRIPFFRNIMCVFIIELPESAMEKSFEYYSEKIWNKKR